MDVSFSMLFHQIQSGVISTIVPDEELARARLDKVFVGQSRDSFSIVETNHSVIGVCSIFGSFIKFIVSSTSDSELVTDEAIQPSKRRRLESDISKSLPSNIINEKNKKDKLYNAIIDFIAEKQLGWREPEKYGKPFVSNLCNVLWFIDGHHEVFSSRSCPIRSFLHSLLDIIDQSLIENQFLI